MEDKSLGKQRVGLFIGSAERDKHCMEPNGHFQQETSAAYSQLETLFR